MTDEDPAPPARRSSIKWRATSMVLIVLASLLTPVAIDALWIKRTVFNTDQFMAQVGPVVNDPDVQTAVVNRLDHSLAQADVQSRVDKALPPKLGFLAAPISTGIATVVHDAATKVVQSDKFAELFNQALRQAHSRLVTVLSGEGKHVDVEKGVVTLDLTDLRNRVVKRVEDSRLGKFVNLAPNKKVGLQLANSPSLAKAQEFLHLLDVFGFVLPLVVVLLGAGAVFCARDRRRGLIRLSVGIAVFCSLHLAALAVGRSLYLNAVSKVVLDKAAAASVFDLLVKFPRVGTRSVLVLVLVMWLGAVLAGPSSGAVKVRALIGALAGRSGDAVGDLGPVGHVGAWVAAHHRGVQGTVIGVGVAILVSLGRLTPRGVLWTAVGVAVVLILVEVLSAAGRVERASPEVAVPVE